MACFVIRSSGEILPKVWQPQAVHWASYESFGLCSTTSIVSPLQSGQKVGRISLAPPSESQYMPQFRGYYPKPQIAQESLPGAIALLCSKTASKCSTVGKG